MADTRASLIVIAPTVEEAVEKGLKDLGLAEDAVEVEVLDSGSKGLFGIGSRHARVRLTMKAPAGEQKPPAPARADFEARSAQPPAAVAEELPEEDEDWPDDEDEEWLDEEDEDWPDDDEEDEDWVDDDFESEDDFEEREPAAGREAGGYETGEESEDDKFALNVARETVVDLLERMQIHAEVVSYYGKPDDARSRAPLCVDITGKDLSILIGPRAETLNALQYISSLIIGKELGRSAPLVVDVEGYRVRREQQIRRVARRMADQAVKTGRRQTLEPMPANERRLVHIELRKDERVTTESVGEDPRRKVTILPK